MSLLKKGWIKLYSFVNSLNSVKPAMLRVKDLAHRNYNYKEKRALYANFVKRGDLCFDVGANVGNRTEVFLDLGCTVVAIEPQPKCMSYLKRKFQSNPRVILIDKALDAKPGKADLFECNADAISSMSTEWINTVKRGRYKDFKWNTRVKVSTTTLDELIKTYGTPAFCKIDVEGFELNVLKGLSKRIPFMSFEYSPERIEPAKKCVRHLARLGSPLFNYSTGETMKLALREWIGPEKILAIVDSLEKAPPGDIYVRFED